MGNFSFGSREQFKSYFAADRCMMCGGQEEKGELETIPSFLFWSSSVFFGEEEKAPPKLVPDFDFPLPQCSL